MYLYKIISPEQWQHSQLQAFVEPTELDHDFIHLAQEHQVDGVIKKFWKDTPYLILTLDSSLLNGKLVLESNRPGGDRYYHLYNGSIPISSVVAIASPST